MGLLDMFDDDQGRLALGLLAASGPRMEPTSFGQRLAGALSSAQKAKEDSADRKMANEYRQAQVQELKAQAAAREFAAAQQQRERQLLGNLLQPTTGAQAASMAGGPTNAAAAMQGQPPPITPQVYQQLIAAGVSPEKVKALADARNYGRDEVARTIETVDEQGRPITVQIDKFGNRVGAGMQQWKAPVQVNRGDRVDFVSPVSLATQGSFGVNMSPSERDASARGWANVGLSRERLNFDKQDGKAPSGYRWGASGQLEAIPGGPADESRKPMTDAQAKANLFGTRAAESNSVINDLEKLGVTRPGIINSTFAAIPFIGGQLSNLTNVTQSTNQQMVEQAQRDFVNAVLRRESGAVISPDEFENARRQYFPQVGDSEDTIRLKRKNRENAVRGLTAEVPESKRSTVQPFTKIFKVDGGSVMGKLGEDGNYYVEKNGKRYRVEE